MVTAEIAAAVPAVVLVLTLCLSGVQLGVDRIRCIDAARVAARELARGDSRGTALARATSVAPRRAAVAAHRVGSDVVVTVTAPPPRALGPAGATTCRAAALVEQTGEGW